MNANKSLYHVTIKVQMVILLLLQASAIFAFVLSPGEIVRKIEIKTTEKPQSTTLKFPAIEKRRGQKICLAFRAYLYLPSPGGWNNYLGMQLNEQILKKHTLNGEARLLRRGDSMQTTFSGLEGVRDWWQHNLLMMFFGSGQGEMDKRLVSPREEGYEYLLDISDLVHYVETGADDRIESAHENTLVLTNWMINRYMPGRKPDEMPNMFFENMRFEYYSDEDLEKMRPSVEPLNYTLAATVATLTTPASIISITEGGGMAITINDEAYYFASAFSYPAQPTMQFNTLTPEKAAGLPSWKPNIRIVNKNQIHLEAESASYRLKRNIVLHDNRLKIKDTFTNKTPEDIGIKAIYTVSVNERLRQGQFFLGGNSETDQESGIADNPTIFVRQNQSSLAVAIYDDAFRAHLEATRKNNTLEFSEANLGLPPNESHTLEYWLYPSTSPDYFNFINRLRRDWKLNYTVLGPFCFDLPSKPKELEIGISVPGPWFEYSDGADINREQYKQQAIEKIAKIKQLDPAIKVLAKMECNLIPIDKNKLKDGDKLPHSGRQYGGKYGYTLTAEQSAIIENTAHSDSLLRWQDGRIIVDTFYPTEPKINLLVQVEKGNYRYHEILEQIDFLLNDVGFDGIYMDQFAAGCGEPLSRLDRCSYDRWDGRTVELASDGKIAWKYYDYQVTGNTGRAEIIRKVLDQKKIFVANTHPTSLLTAQMPAIHFREMENDNIGMFLMEPGKPRVWRNQCKSQLSSAPLILGLRPVRFSKDQDQWATILQRGVILALRHGLLYYYYGHHINPGTGGYGVVNHMFPFTPVELGEGFLIGKERIITAVSREFITAKRPDKVLIFDLNGLEKPEKPEPVQIKDGWKTTIQLNDWNETAVIIFGKEK